MGSLSEVKRAIAKPSGGQASDGEACQKSGNLLGTQTSLNEACQRLNE
ncbi:hypothetical protein Acr_01g0008210 [Actinidia rufa]|uniref:Uncharacterized protein n=1 Tax=Actinidia rufa TaxID=165716 RepID=A0A7J0E409_9ERIC|nr:hypothetical protein Acr_01g0008210 [Actinidia rufa]